MSNEALYSPEVEEALIGRAIANEDDRKFICENLKKGDFQTSRNQILFEEISQLERDSKPADLTILFEQLKKKKLHKKSAELADLVELCNRSTWSVNLKEYVQIIKEQTAKRNALSLIQSESIRISRNPMFSQDGLITFIDQLKEISKGASENSFLSLKEVGKTKRGENSSFLDELIQRQSYYSEHKKPFVDGVSTGYIDLDRMIGGFCNANFVVLAGRPGMGKTALALNFLMNVVNQGHSAGILSLEMTSTQVYERLLSKESGVNGIKIREGSFDEAEAKKITKSNDYLVEQSIYILDGNSHIHSLLNQIRRLKEEKGIHLFIIDYLQLIQGEGESRLLEISNITRALKNLSLELNIPILCLSQLSRKVEERTDRKPQLSDLRESGTIEQDADSVILLMCPDYYDEYNRPGEADLIIAKNRHGETGKITLKYLKKLSKFENFYLLGEGGNEYF